MPEVFPITATLVAPNWIDEPQLSGAAHATTQFLNGAVSTLRYTDTQTGGELLCHWDGVDDDFLAEFLGFWRLVDMIDSFTLPAAFFRPEWLSGRVANYRAASPTGNWKFRQKPKILDLNLHSYQITATIVASIL